MDHKLEHITRRPDSIVDNYLTEHPSAARQEWPQMFPTGEFYRWKLRFFVDDTQDSVKDYSFELDEILDLFEYAIKRDILREI